MREIFFLAAVGSIGLSFLGAVILSGRYRRLYEQTTGTVRLVYRYMKDDVIHIRVYYVYRDETGREYEGSSSTRTHFSPYLEGEQIPVLYLRTDPEKSVINVFREKYATSLFLFGFSFFLFVCGLLSRPGGI